MTEGAGTLGQNLETTIPSVSLRRLCQRPRDFAFPGPLVTWLERKAATEPWWLGGGGTSALTRCRKLCRRRGLCGLRPPWAGRPALHLGKIGSPDAHEHGGLRAVSSLLEAVLPHTPPPLDQGGPRRCPLAGPLPAARASANIIQLSGATESSPPPTSPPDGDDAMGCRDLSSGSLPYLQPGGFPGGRGRNNVGVGGRRGLGIKCTVPGRAHCPAAASWPSAPRTSWLRPPGADQGPSGGYSAQGKGGRGDGDPVWHAPPPSRPCWGKADRQIPLSHKGQASSESCSNGATGQGHFGGKEDAPGVPQDHLHVR